MSLINQYRSKPQNATSTSLIKNLFKNLRGSINSNLNDTSYHRSTSPTTILPNYRSTIRGKVSRDNSKVLC